MPKLSADADKALRKRIEEAIPLLASKDYEAFMRALLPPKKLASMEGQPGAVSAIAKNAGPKLERLHALLLQSRDMQPIVRSNGESATFEAPFRPEDGPPFDAEFRLFDGVWYLD